MEREILGLDAEVGCWEEKHSEENCTPFYNVIIIHNEK